MNQRDTTSSPPSSPTRYDGTTVADASPINTRSSTNRNVRDIEEANNTSPSSPRTPVYSGNNGDHQPQGGDDDDDDDMTEINIDEGEHVGGSNFVSRLERIHGRNYNGIGASGTSRFFWSEEEERAYEEQRRERLSEELLRIQRKNFVHFSILCMVPVFLLVLVLVSSLTSNQTCNGYEIASCEFEERSFLNAFTRRCICTAFPLK